MRSTEAASRTTRSVVQDKCQIKSFRPLRVRVPFVSAKGTTALREQREQRNWPEGRRAGCPKSNHLPRRRRCDEAASAPCAPQQKRAGPNSAIRGLKHAGVAPVPASGARLALRCKSREQSKRQANTSFNSRQAHLLAAGGAAWSPTNEMLGVLRHYSFARERRSAHARRLQESTACRPSTEKFPEAHPKAADLAKHQRSVATEIS